MLQLSHRSVSEGHTDIGHAATDGALNAVGDCGLQHDRGSQPDLFLYMLLHDALLGLSALSR